MSKSERIAESYDSLLKWARRAALPAVFLAWLMLVAGLIASIVGIVSCWYFIIQLDWAILGWVLPILFALLPAAGVFVFWYAFSLVRDLPEVVENVKGRFLEQYPKYKNFVTSGEERSGLINKAKFGVNLAVDVYSIADEVEGAFMGTAVLAFAATPLAWLIAVIAFVLSVAGPLVLVGIILVHYFLL